MSRKVIIISLISVVCLAAIGGGVYYFVIRDRNSLENKPVRPENSVDYSPGKPEDSAGVQSDKDKTADKNKPGNDTPSTSSSLSTEITMAQQSNDQITIRAIVQGTTEGTCTLTLTRGSHTITRTAPVGVQASYALCQGFNIPVTQIPEKGQWKAKVTVTSGDKTSAPSEKQFQVDK